MKRISNLVLKHFCNSLELSGFSYDCCVLGKTMIKVYASQKSNMFSYSFMKFIGEFCVNNGLIYYITSQDYSGRVYVVLHVC